MWDESAGVRRDSTRRLWGEVYIRSRKLDCLPWTLFPYKSHKYIPITSKLDTEEAQLSFVSQQVCHIDTLDRLSPEEYAARERKLLWKIDLRLMPILFTIIVLNYLDRNALANARVLDIEESLNLNGSDFNTCISIFFAGYLTLQIPSNLLLTRVRPSIYLVSISRATARP